MVDVDGLSRHINILTHRYLSQSSCMRADDIVQQPFVCSYDSFNTYSNPRRITASDTTITTEVSSILLLLSIIHYSPINFMSASIAQFYSGLSPKQHNVYHIVPPEVILWLSFDTITTYFGSLLSLFAREICY